ncbi:unnamed protein product [Ectocarpus sp. 8 AP-2014]
MGVIAHVVEALVELISPPIDTMDQAKFEDEMRALAVCVKCLDETKPRASLKWCTGCRMVLYCSPEHQKGHWQDHKAFCKARKKLAAAFPVSRDSWVPPLSSPHGGAAIGKRECEVYVSVCDATGVFSILGMFWKEDEKDRASSSSRLCSLMVQLGKGPVACLESKLQDWEPRTRWAALKTLTVQGSADYVRVTRAMAASLTRRALEDARRPGNEEKKTGGAKGSFPGKFDSAAAYFLDYEGKAGEGGGVDSCGLEEYLDSEAHASFKRTLLECCDGGDSLDVFFFGLLNERREFRHVVVISRGWDCYSFLEGMAELGGAESFEDALEKLARQGEAGGRSDSNTNGRATARLCEHACLCFHLAGLPGAASAMHIAKESCEEDFASSPFVRAMMYRTAYRNSKGEEVPSPKPELSERYTDMVMKPLQHAQARQHFFFFSFLLPFEATGQHLAQLTPVSVEIKALLEQEILL